MPYKIIFNAMKTNLGNTGGCRTIVESAKTLRNMGHKVDIACKKNRYTWEKFRTISELRDCDICIAVSCLDIDSTKKAAAKRKAYWRRGREDWFYSLPKIYKKCKGIQVVCNAQHLADEMAKHGIKSGVCYSGVDEWVLEEHKRIPERIGCLYSDRSTKKWKDFRRLARVLGDRYQYVCYGTKRATDGFLYGAATSPGRSTLNKLYNRCSFWFSPSISEGCHQVPLEAACCGCLIVAVDKPSGGTGDYCTPETGFRYKSIKEAANFIRNPDPGKVDKMYRLIHNKIGTREDCMGKLLEVIA